MTCATRSLRNNACLREQNGKSSSGSLGISSLIAPTPETSLISICQAGSSPTKMRLSDSVTSDFDISAILARVSGRESNENSTVNDGLLNMLDKISSTGQQLKGELENAKMREDSLFREMHQLRTGGNESFQLSPIKMPPCARCSVQNGVEMVPHNREVADALMQKCEKLQDALLSLEEENMRLNRLLRHAPSLHSNDLSIMGGDNGTKAIEERLKFKEKEIQTLRAKVEELQKLFNAAEKEIAQDKERNLKIANPQNKVSVGLNTSISEEQLSVLQQKANSLQKKNAEYLARIQHLEAKLKLGLEAVSTEDIYKLRIEDLQNLLVAKEGEFVKLKERLTCVTRDLEEKDKRAKVVQNKDICKRKEVLLLCEKYEQLKKKLKRLECDFHGSQKKLQESNTKCWALESSLQRTAEENEILKHQLGLLEGFMVTAKTSKSSASASSLVKDYERLTGKYEELLSIRLRDYDKLKSGSKSRKLLKKMNGLHHTDEYDKRKHIRKALFTDDDRRDEMLEELMWKREQDLRRFNGRGNTSASRISQPHEIEIPRQITVHDRRPQNIPNPVDSQREIPQQTSQSYRSTPAQTIDHQRSKMSVNSPRYLRDTPRKDAILCANQQIVPSDLRPDRLTSTPVKKPSPSSFSLERNAAFHQQGSSSLQQGDAVARLRSKSLSPVRNGVVDLCDMNLNDSQNSTSKESQKSVSFCLTPTHRRANSAGALEIGTRKRLDVTPSETLIAPTKKRTVSPVEVLKRVKSAYQEEYIRNMNGVGISFSPPKTSENDLKASAGASLCGERYKTITQNLKNFVERSYISEPPMTPTPRQHYHSINGSRPKSPSPKGILKKPKPDDESVSSMRRTPSPTLSSEIQKAPVVVREKIPSHVAEYDSRRNEEFYASERKHGHSPVEIIDVNPTPIDRNGKCVSLNSSKESVGSNFGAGETQNDRELRINDLTAPIQFTKSLKNDEDNDSDSISQSSIASTRDHIGRFEFLEEMRSSLKNPSFAYQKPEEKPKRVVQDDIDATQEKNTSGELGLSARQQEYADKLIEKYTKRS